MPSSRISLVKTARPVTLATPSSRGTERLTTRNSPGFMRMSRLLMVSSKSTPSARFARSLPLTRGRLSLLLPYQAGGTADRFQNRAVAGAAAKVAIHVAHNLGVRRFRVLFKERLGRKDH